MSPYLKGFLITFLGVVIISPDVLLIRLIDAHVYTQLFWRGTLSGTAILLFYLATTRQEFVPNLRALGWPGLWIVTIFTAGTFCFVYSATHTLAANTLFISSTTPAFAALISVVFLSEKVPARTWAAIIVSLGGIAIIASGSSASAGGSLDGDLAALGAAVAMAAVFSIARANRTASMVPAMGLAGLATGFVAMLLAPTLMVPSDSTLWVALLGLIVVPVGFGLLTTGTRYLPAPDVSLLLLLEAIFGPFLVWLVLAESPGSRTFVGGAVVLGAMAFSNLVVLWDARRTS